MRGLRFITGVLVVAALLACCLVFTACTDREFRPYAEARKGATPAPGYMALSDQAAAPREELWIIATDRARPAAGAGSPHGAGGFMAASSTAQTVPIPGSPILIKREMGAAAAPIFPKHTDVHADIAGGMACVSVSQRFVNDSGEKLAAVYVFPLPGDAAVNDFVVTIGDRHIRGIIRERGQAQRIYDQASRQGIMVSMLDELRPNIFAQSIANIDPGKQIDISIRYFHMLDDVDGVFEWRFPLVRGTQVAASDPFGGSAARARPPATRSGRDLSLSVELAPGFPITGMESPGFPIRQSAGAGDSQNIELVPADAIPNQDFVLRFRPVSAEIHTALFLQKDPHGSGGWFSVLLVPPAAPRDAAPRPRLLTGIELAFPEGTQTAEVFPREIPDLFAGKPFLVTGRFTDRPPSAVTISAAADDRKMQFHAAAEPSDFPAIGALWASMKIADLRRRAGPGDADAIKATALSQGLISEYTNFIAVDALSH